MEAPMATSEVKLSILIVVVEKKLLVGSCEVDRVIGGVDGPVSCRSSSGRMNLKEQQLQ